MSVYEAQQSHLTDKVKGHARADEAFARTECLDSYRAVAVILYAFYLAYELTRAESGSYAFRGARLDMVLRSLQLPSVFFVLTGLLTFLPFVQAALNSRAGASS